MIVSDTDNSTLRNLLRSAAGMEGLLVVLAVLYFIIAHPGFHTPRFYILSIAAYGAFILTLRHAPVLADRVDEKRAQFEQAFERVEEALELSSGAPSQEHVSCLLLGAGLHQRLGRYPQAREWGERAFTMANQIGSQRDQ